MTDLFLAPLEGRDLPRVEQAKTLMRAVTYQTTNVAFDHFEDKPDQKVVVCEVWTPGESGKPGDEWMRWLGLGYDRLDMEDFWTAVLLTIHNVETMNNPGPLKVADDSPVKDQ